MSPNVSCKERERESYASFYASRVDRQSFCPSPRSYSSPQQLLEHDQGHLQVQKQMRGTIDKKFTFMIKST